MNQYRCETCKHRFTPDYWKDGCNRFGKTFMSDDEMRFISTYGCASHSDYQSERERAISKFADLIHTESVRLSPAMVDMVYSYRVAQIIEELRQAGEP